MPPAATKPTPTAPATTKGSFAFTLLRTSVARATSARSVVTASTSFSRSAPMSRRRSCSASAILHRLQRQLCLLDRLLGNGRCASLDFDPPDCDERGDDE